MSERTVQSSKTVAKLAPAIGASSTSSKHLRLVARHIADSRGKPTVQVEAEVAGIKALGDVPAGASKGEDEAQTVEIGKAIKNITERILPTMQSADVELKDVREVGRIDAAMVAYAGVNFKDLGANATLPVSRALYALCAKLNDMPLYALLREAMPDLASNRRVHFFMNIFNGGLHALKTQDKEVLGRDRIDIQEIMVVPVRAKTYREAMQAGEKIDAALKALLVKKYGTAAVTRADEAGFSVKGLGSSSQAIAHVVAAIKQAGFVPGEDIKLALDVAASSFYDAKTSRYQFQGKNLSNAEMIDYLKDFSDTYKGMVLSIEDGLAENDWDGWKVLTQAMGERGVITIGDDLFVTQLPRLRQGLMQSSAHAILIKVNQNGTVHGTLKVMQLAQKNKMQCVVSHRSGETLDDSIADLAYAFGALGLKSGDPQPEVDFPDKSTHVRRAKYLRMIAIEERLDKKS